MKNKNNLFLTAMLAIVLAFGMTLIGCGDGSDNGGNGGGGGGGASTLTITDIPSEYNGKYALYWNDSNPVLIGCQSIDVGADTATTTFTLVQISNGKVNLPMWKAEGKTAVKYSGNETVSAKSSLSILTSQIMKSTIEDPSNWSLVVAVIGPLPITFSNGSATVSANDGTLIIP